MVGSPELMIAAKSWTVDVWIFACWSVITKIEGDVQALVRFRHHPSGLFPNSGAWMLPNGLRISCRPSSYRPHKPTLPLLGPRELSVREEPRPAQACRLHARVRPHERRAPTDLSAPAHNSVTKGS